ncbi:Sec-independent protein translocase subunit TatB [Photobacterium sp. GJ3]|uniref:Sec-independent protein translocase protein TatB n=1 Tax=Photobacterium sp. GJ3 TaxID=2829502 RepID=UPI001B8C8087|nr:Sec-independent protein translocase protein TatB [Photobacterium sp. GJ3]QUJ67432.1 Sec-independent protein translocase subunit TatB [Photobacterium sp. GJ3]
MFDIGFWELILIGVVGLIVLGPERLPVAIRSVSRWVNAARNMATAVKTELSQELKIHELHQDLKKAEQAGMQDLAPDLQKSVEELREAAASVQRPYAKSEPAIEPEHAADIESQQADSPLKDAATESKPASSSQQQDK